jgi:membrane-associated protease RseP (regulator of RpoE activity)
MMFVALVGVGAFLGFASTSVAQSSGGLGLKPDRAELSLRQVGLQVIGVVPGSPAALQGFEADDIILSVDGHPVRSLADLNLWIGRAGRVAQLDVIDCNTGWPTEVSVNPVMGRIGVRVRPVPLDNHRPFPPRPWGLDRSPIEVKPPVGLGSHQKG